MFWRVAALAVIAGGLSLRLWRLDYQSFWSDEGATAVMAQRTLPEIWQNAALDIHPPLFYVVERIWAAGAGTSEYALRFVSVAAGILLLALLFALCRRLLGALPGLLATIFATTSPILILYSQEARMYAMLAFLATLSFYLALRLVGFPGVGRDGAPGTSRSTHLGLSSRLRSPQAMFVFFVAATVAALMTQYYAASTLVVAGSLALALLLTRQIDLRRFLIVCSGLVLAIILYLPWLIVAAPVLAAWPSISDPFGPGELATRLFAHFTYGVAAELNQGAASRLPPLAFLAAAFLAPLVLSMPGARGFGARWGRLAIAAVALLTPPIMMLLVSISRPSYNPKLLLHSVPVFDMFLALGAASFIVLAIRAATRARFPLAASWSAAGAVALILVLVMSAPLARAQAAYFDDPKYARDDYRGLVAHLTAFVGANDAVILNAPGQVEIFHYYAQGAFNTFPLPKERPLDESRTVAALSDIAAGYDRVWTVNWAVEQSDPDRLIDRWLGETAFRAGSRWFGSVELVPYVNNPSAGPQIEGPFAFENGIVLERVVLGSSTRDGSASQGEVLTTTLEWRADGKPNQNYVVFVHLLGPGGTLWGQHDAAPAGGTRPTGEWSIGDRIEDRHGIAVLAGTPPGIYAIEIGLYNPINGERLPLRDGSADHLVIPDIEVARAASVAPAGGLRTDRLLNLTSDGFEIIGFELGPVGKPLEVRDFSPADQLFLALLWRRGASSSGTPSPAISAVASSGNVATRRWYIAPAGHYPPSEWRENELVRTQFRLTLGLGPGRYEIRLSFGSEEKSLAWIDVTS